ncbi:MAG: hypothetical protein WC842_02415 [Candidatus Paceibacterota bacterium]
MKKEQLVSNKNIRLVVNGGSTVLESATVPVEWHLSDELIAKKPKCLVICDLEMSLDLLKENRETVIGNRYFCKVTDLVKYLQLFRSGKHSLVVLVFYGDDAEIEAKFYLEKDSKSRYDKSVWFSDLVDQDKGYAEVTFFEFEIPEELFAQKPESKFGKFVWNWVNGWFSSKPIDECEYRKRKILAFTLKPIFWSFIAAIQILWTIIGCSIVLFLGYRPVSLWKNIISTFTDDDQFQWDLRYYQDWDPDYYWRLWKKEWSNGKCEKTYIPLFFVPWISLLTIGCFVGIGYIFISSFFTVVSLALYVALPSLASYFFLRWYFNDKKVTKREEKKREKKREKAKKTQEEEIQFEKEAQERMTKFLKEYASLNLVPQKVDIKRVIPVVNTATKFTLRFWNMKAKVCKPFAR